MSQLLIQHYLNELQTLRRVSGTPREGVVSEAFKTLLNDWGKSRDLVFVPQYEYQTLQKMRVYPDGALLHALHIFEDSREAILIQRKQQVMRCGVEDPAQL